MASQTPAASTRKLSGRMGRLRYLEGWAALTRLMDSGVSWSGHERNCVFLNLGEAGFADASSLMGLDFEDDGRAVASVDWDGDGDLDLWLRNRTGPQLRFMRNELGSTRHAVSFLLEGRTCNRDAIGARVDVVTQSGQRTRFISGGDGYLSQSSRWLLFGLGGITQPVSVAVTWPGGKREQFGSVPTNGRYRLVEGTGHAAAVDPRTVSLKAGTLPQPKAPAAFRVMLRTPLAIPPTLVQKIWGGARPQRATLINLWASWCLPCREELADLADHARDLDAAGLDLVALGLDLPRDRAEAARLFEERATSRTGGISFLNVPVDPGERKLLEIMLDHVLGRPEGLTVPTSLLFDRLGELQIVYIGRASSGQILEDVRRCVATKIQGAFRSFYPGRWYFSMPRDLAGLAKRLEEAGFAGDAKFFRARR